MTNDWRTISEEVTAQVNAGTHKLAMSLTYNDRILFQANEWNKPQPFRVIGWPRWGLTHGYVEFEGERIRKDGEPGKRVVLSCKANEPFELVKDEDDA